MRDEHQVALYQRLLDFSVDCGGEELTFASRLARENGWTPSFTNRVMVEYKRFLFLAAVAGHPVTPSDQVDQVWHLHLTYTRSYWDKLCGEVLEMPLHHGPTRGGEAESRKFDDWYGKTLESYRFYFGDESPADIWPPSSVRFGEDLHYQRVNTKRNWLFPIPRILAGIGAKLSWVFIFCAVLAVATASSSFVSGSGNSTPQEGAKIYMADVSNTIAFEENGYQSAATDASELERDKLAIDAAMLEARRLKNELKVISDELARKKRVLDRTNHDAVDSLNREVNEYNTLVESSKTQHQRYELMVSEYNKKVSEYKAAKVSEFKTKIVGGVVLFSFMVCFLFVFPLIRQRKCPECSKYFALIRVLSSDEHAEGKCKYCRYSGPWPLLRRGGGGGGGGCGGCGG